MFGAMWVNGLKGGRPRILSFLFISSASLSPSHRHKLNFCFLVGKFWVFGKCFRFICRGFYSFIIIFSDANISYLQIYEVWNKVEGQGSRQF